MVCASYRRCSRDHNTHYPRILSIHSVSQTLRDRTDFQFPGARVGAWKCPSESWEALSSVVTQRWNLDSLQIATIHVVKPRPIISRVRFGILMELCLDMFTPTYPLIIPPVLYLADHDDQHEASFPTLNVNHLIETYSAS